jgi:hypothetical protein
MFVPFQLPELTEEQQRVDLLPKAFDTRGEIDASTSRLLAEADGLQYFAARAGDEVCLIVYHSAESWASGCSANLPIYVKLGDFPEAQLSSTALVSDDWEAISERIAIRSE